MKDSPGCQAGGTSLAPPYGWEGYLDESDSESDTDHHSRRGPSSPSLEDPAYLGVYDTLPAVPSFRRAWSTWGHQGDVLQEDVLASAHAEVRLEHCCGAFPPGCLATRRSSSSSPLHSGRVAAPKPGRAGGQQARRGHLPHLTSWQLLTHTHM